MRYSIVAALVMSLEGLAAGQQQPDFSGVWALVAESSSPALQSVLGSRARIAHQPAELALEMPLWFVTEKAAAQETGEFDAPKRYRLDGAEHAMAGQRPTPVRHPDGSPRGSLMPMWPTAGRYRAIWTGDKLVILSHDQLPLVSDGGFQFVNLTIRTGLSLSPEGLLVVERVAIQEPVPSRRAQPAPEPTRSVYRKVR